MYISVEGSMEHNGKALIVSETKNRYQQSLFIPQTVWLLGSGILSIFKDTFFLAFPATECSWIPWSRLRLSTLDLYLYQGAVLAFPRRRIYFPGFQTRGRWSSSPVSVGVLETALIVREERRVSRTSISLRLKYSLLDSPRCLIECS